MESKALAPTDGTWTVPRMLGKLKRMSWWQVGILIICLFGIFVACLALWLRSTSDLAAIDARARSLGLPSDPTELMLAESTPAQLADWRQLLALAERVPPWGDSEVGRTWIAQPGAEPPAALREHHATFDAAVLAEIRTLLSRLGEAPLDADRSLTLGAPMPDTVALRRLMRLWCERIALAEVEALPDEVATAAALIPLRETAGLLRLMVVTNLGEQWASAVMLRARDLGSAAAPTAALARRLADLPVGGLERSWRNDLAVLRGFVTDADPGRAWARLGRDGGSFSLDAWGFAIALRAGRASTVMLMQDVAVAMRGDPLDLTRQLNAARLATQEASRPSWFRPGSLLPAMTLPVSEPVVAATHAARLRLLLVAAELDGTPWPKDVFDPNHGSLRRIERDGQLIGAYSVGADGRDDGGKAPIDRRWPLYGPLDP